MSEVNVTTLDGKEYIELDTITIKDNEYVYLVNENDEYDFKIRKIINEDGKSYYEPLKTNEEFDLAMLMFTKKHNDELKEI